MIKFLQIISIRHLFIERKLYEITSIFYETGVVRMTDVQPYFNKYMIKLPKDCRKDLNRTSFLKNCMNII